MYRCIDCIDCIDEDSMYLCIYAILLSFVSQIMIHTRFKNHSKHVFESVLLYVRCIDDDEDSMYMYCRRIYEDSMYRCIDV